MIGSYSVYRLVFDVTACTIWEYNKRRDPAYVGGWQMNMHVHLIVIIRGFKKLCSMATGGLVGRGVCVRVRVMSLYPGTGGGGVLFFSL